MSRIFDRGEAVYFHHLHDRRPVHILSGPDDRGEYLFQIEGKARPMLVIARKPRVYVETAENTNVRSGANTCTFYKAKGQLGYLVLPIGHSKPPGQSLPYPNLLGDGTDSFIDLQWLWYPVESVAQRKNQSAVQLDEHALAEIEKQLAALKLGYGGNKWDRA